MDRNFDKSLKLILKHEGGWADNPKDPGGATMKGVTIGTFRSYVNPKATKDDLRKITDAQLETVYRRQYWDRVLGAKLPSGVDHAVFDFAVNSGPSTAAKYLQRAVGVDDNGRVGPETLKAVEAMPTMRLIEKLMADREAFMRRIKNRKTGELLWKTFGRGWAARLKRVREEALAMSKAPAIEKPVVVPAQTSEGDKAVVILPAETTVQTTSTPSVPVSKTGWATLFAILTAALAGLTKYFGGF